MSDARRSHPRPDDLTTVRVRADTIVATATAPGRAALAVIRLSGPRAEPIARAVLSRWPETARTLTRCTVHEPGPNSVPIDEAMAVVFPAPHSYTGETVVEIHSHGGLFVPGAIEAALVSAGARPALAGEFTERAVLNGKLDLVRAEAVGELIDARTRALHRSALHALSGVRTQEYAALRAGALALEALIAYDVDFPEEDDGPVSRDRVAVAASELHDALHRLCEGASRATLARDGALVILAGAPNAGKSSLLNALIGESRVIVSDEPGTTRDAIEVLLDADPWPMRLVDTAGIRDGAGVVERLGIEVSERYLRNADVVVLCSENEGGRGAVRERISRLTNGEIVEVATKADLRTDTPTADGTIRVSATTGEGIDALRTLLQQRVGNRAGAGDTSPVVSSARQRAALEGALAEVKQFLDAWKERQLPAPVVASHLRAATTMLEELIGAIDVDEILARVFSTFCVGK